VPNLGVVTEMLTRERHDGGVSGDRG
jgi:hypothetical protein